MQWKLQLKLGKGSTFRKVEKSTMLTLIAARMHGTVNKPHEKPRLHSYNSF